MGDGIEPGACDVLLAVDGHGFCFRQRLHFSSRGGATKLAPCPKRLRGDAEFRRSTPVGRVIHLAAFTADDLVEDGVDGGHSRSFK